MRRIGKANGIVIVSGVGSSTKDLDVTRVVVSAEVRVDGMVRQADIRIEIPNELLGAFTGSLKNPIEQIPLFRPELLRLNINRA